MSDLQIGLLLIGAAIVAGVLLFNWIQERRFRRQADAAFQAPLGDALMQPGAVPREAYERIEPALQEPGFDVVRVGETDADNEPHWSADADAPQGGNALEPPAPAVSASPTPAPPRPAAPASPAPYDELIEYRIRVGADSVPASAFSEAFSHARTLGKAVRWAGLPVGATEWEELQPWRDVRYQQVVITMQLADRNGAVQEEQLATLCSVLQSMAQSHALRIACDDVVDALERAQAIDRFCVDVDVLIGLNVVARGEGAVNLTRIEQAAADSGMVLGVDGVFQLLDSRGEPLYALCNHDAEPFSPEVVEGQTSQGVTLQFDVPRVPDGLKVFDGMVGFGRKLANEVGGILVDDNLRPLTDTGIEKIRTQLMQIYERMEARGVPSGSRRALRLFS
ncbi:MAG: cell division protein ZipA C-terminal FtsZ-binding domain-containing protein [Gammaproteobacteria bacterium]|nr:cell division protein ZipA C-terminal FtsZ-binding domain-containing protein [Gammaproteobacteria bacterium]MBU1407634.1 cell division protein ZipA C-terminal FtsZ-binding domain-containing protein [Gammaproteobacteria bacterium]MBU1531747.1 cell division protein ZipA C-terminal FtsZ-binding domain-containing protein [Gammaproteobacteria bacterium]